MRIEIEIEKGITETEKPLPQEREGTRHLVMHNEIATHAFLIERIERGKGPNEAGGEDVVDIPRILRRRHRTRDLGRGATLILVAGSI